MRRILTGLTALLVISGMLLTEESEAGRRRRRCCNPCYGSGCCAPQPWCCYPPTTGSPAQYCNVQLFMPPNTYEGNDYDSNCQNPSAALCTGSGGASGTTCGAYTVGCSSGSCVSIKGRMSAKGITSNDYHYDGKGEGNQYVGNDQRLQAAFSNDDITDKINAARQNGYTVFDAYWVDKDGMKLRLLKCSKSRHSFYIGFEVSEPPANSNTKQLGADDCSSGTPTSPQEADWTFIKNVYYTANAYSQIQGKMFVAITTKTKE